MKCLDEQEVTVEQGMNETEACREFEMAVNDEDGDVNDEDGDANDSVGK